MGTGDYDGDGDGDGEKKKTQAPFPFFPGPFATLLVEFTPSSKVQGK